MANWWLWGVRERERERRRRTIIHKAIGITYHKQSDFKGDNVGNG